MTDQDTLPPSERITETDHLIPRPSPLPDFTDPDVLAAALAEAPVWAQAVVFTAHQTRGEMSTVMSEFAATAAALERQNREILANQEASRRAFDDLRSEFRSRVGAHDNEFEDVRRRLTELELDKSTCESRHDAIQREIDALKRRVGDA